MEEFNQKTKMIYSWSGEAPEMPIEQSVSIDGVLSAPRKYIENKVDQELENCLVDYMKHSNDSVYESKKVMYNYKQAILKVMNETKAIRLELNCKSNVQDEIVGSLSFHEIWSVLKVNQEHSWTIGDLRKILKRVKFYFNDPDQHSHILEHLYNFNAKIQKKVVDRNADADFEKSTAVELINWTDFTEFKIKAPVYKGYENKVVRVDVQADVSDGSVRYQLESQDLFQLQEELWMKYLEGEIKFFRDNDISIITIN